MLGSRSSSVFSGWNKHVKKIIYLIKKTIEDKPHDFVMFHFSIIAAVVVKTENQSITRKKHQAFPHVLIFYTVPKSGKMWVQKYRLRFFICLSMCIYVLFYRVVILSFLLFQQSSWSGDDAGAGQAVLKVDAGDFFFEEIIAFQQLKRTIIDGEQQFLFKKKFWIRSSQFLI